MDAQSYYHKANEAYIEDDFEEAAKLYTAALNLDPSNSTIIAKRARCNEKLGLHVDAVADATRAIELNAELFDAYLIKGIACFELEEYETARSALVKGKETGKNNDVFEKWLKKVDDALALEGISEGSNKVTEMPTNEATPSTAEPQSVAPVSEAANDRTNPQPPTKAGPSPDNLSQAVRHEWYQTPNEIVVGVLLKGAAKDSVTVALMPRNFSFSVILPNGDTASLDLDLAEAIDPDWHKATVLATKVEVRLRKQTKGKMWNSLERAKQTHSSTRPSYPSSHSRGPQDWDKLAGQIAEEEKEENMQGDAAVTKLFQQIYANADEATRRAMNKSFVESGGTVLSTNWSEVGKKRVDMQVPDGMVPKSYEQ